jgi:hypothetical protein
LFVMSLLFNKSDKVYFAIDTDLIKTYMKDMFFFLLLITSILCVTGSMYQRKKYFKYKTEGPRAIRAYNETISMVCAITIIFPYFLLV